MPTKIENLHTQERPSLGQRSQRNSLYKVIGKRVREARHMRGLTQRELAQMIGVNHSFISQIEAGTQANLTVLKKIGDTLGKGVEYFFWENERKKLFERLLAEKPIRQFLKTFLKLRAEDRTAVTKIAEYLENKAGDKE